MEKVYIVFDEWKDPDHRDRDIKGVFRYEEDAILKVKELEADGYADYYYYDDYEIND